THKLTLHTTTARYLAANQLGAVSAKQEARSAQEEWAFEPVPTSPNNDHPDADGRFKLKSCLYNKFLSVEELASGKLVIHADSNSPAKPAAHLLVRMQAAELLKARKRLADDQQHVRNTSPSSSSSTSTLIHPYTLNSRQYQARGAGQLQPPAKGKAGLKKARKEGWLAKELLDRRAKLKSNRYAK
ncbi:hypothetical protein PTTG_10041, partial [Puccinia triticina 1-1 BBBD Race 1]|uniref:Uncharacterized protein n=1 Tax=Puccinia triticina (isolate 1-1 / race 1 (BBBD)) TaxID=630390 RepID=A0A0C4FA05_PUCT1